jgi:hypothetical protein
MNVPPIGGMRNIYIVTYMNVTADAFCIDDRIYWTL